MPILKGIDRSQTSFFCLEDVVAADSEVRLIDAFVDYFDLSSLELKSKGESKEGRSAYANSDLLKLYLYAYLNRTRSSRRIARLCQLNIEAKWLVKGLHPCYVTIANFRKDNSAGLIKLFKGFVKFLSNPALDLFDKDTVAIDGSNFSGQNSKSNNYTSKKITREMNHIEKQVTKYLEELDNVDAGEQDEYNQERRLEIADKLEHLKKREEKYSELADEMSAAEKRGATQISTTDPDTRSLAKRNSAVVGVNAVTTAEAKNKFVVDVDIINQPDTHALSKSAIASKEVLGCSKEKPLKALGDAGFDTGAELKKCMDNDIETYVAPRKVNNGSKVAPYRNEDFYYDEEQDDYTCPAEERLVSNGQSYTKKSAHVGGKDYQFKTYKIAFEVCANCPLHNQCLSASSIKAKKGRSINRSEYQNYKDENKERVKFHKDLYRKRQEIIEHQFGTIKRGWGYSYTLMKGLPKIKGEFCLIFTVYNLRRAISILGVKKLIELLKAGSISNFCAYRIRFKPNSGIKIFTISQSMKIKAENREVYKPAMAA